MKSIITRLSELEIKIKNKSNIPVLIVAEKVPNIFTYKNFTFHGKDELKQFCAEHGVENLIIDDICRN